MIFYYQECKCIYITKTQTIEDHINHNQYSVCGGVAVGGGMFVTTLFCRCYLGVEKLNRATILLKISVVFTPIYQRRRMREPLIRNEMLMCEEAVYVLKNKD